MPKSKIAIKKAQKYFGINKQYNVIVADPPWSYKHCTKIGKADDKYPTMSDFELENMPVKGLADDNCALLLWCVSPKLPAAIDLCKAWGFSYKTIQHIWIKTQKKEQSKVITNGLGWYTRPAAEIMIIALRGNIKAIKGSQEEGSNKVGQLIFASRRGHSRKPEEVREAIDKFFRKDCSKIELFARSRYKDWDVWGNETTAFDHQEAEDAWDVKEESKTISWDNKKEAIVDVA
jgi:N6-adenosine-specific RNA methylase IME4